MESSVSGVCPLKTLGGVTERWLFPTFDDTMQQAMDRGNEGVSIEDLGTGQVTRKGLALIDTGVYGLKTLDGFMTLRI